MPDPRLNAPRSQTHVLAAETAPPDSARPHSTYINTTRSLGKHGCNRVAVSRASHRDPSPASLRLSRPPRAVAVAVARSSLIRHGLVRVAARDQVASDLPATPAGPRADTGSRIPIPYRQDTPRTYQGGEDTSSSDCLRLVLCAFAAVCSLPACPPTLLTDNNSPSLSCICACKSC